MRMECKKFRKNWEKRDGDQINVGLLFNTINNGGGVGGVLVLVFVFCVESDFVVVGCAIPAYLLVNNVSAYVYAKLSYDRLCSLFYALSTQRVEWHEGRVIFEILSSFCPLPLCLVVS